MFQSRSIRRAAALFRDHVTILLGAGHQDHRMLGATGRYKELELDFANETGALRGVFAYPWKMTWQECRRL